MHNMNEEVAVLLAGTVTAPQFAAGRLFPSFGLAFADTLILSARLSQLVGCSVAWYVSQPSEVYRLDSSRLPEVHMIEGECFDSTKTPRERWELCIYAHWEYCY